ncbi:MAG: ABC transporter ATP-binding protein [Thermodesulfobacteriota bacterium]
MPPKSKTHHEPDWQDPGQQPLLAVKDLKTWFAVKRGIFSRQKHYVRAVDGVSWTLNTNETLGLVGESGCGKTTLGRTLLGLEAATAGDMRFLGKSIPALSRKQMNRLRRRIQVIFQDPLSSLNPRMNVMDIVTEGLVQFKMLRESKKAHAERLMREVGLSGDVIYRFPHEFSGGQRQRINIARAVSMRPDLIICDEAVSALDVSIQAQAINLLQTLQEQHHLSYLFISHDLSVVSNIADRVAVMYLGRIVESGNTADIIERPLHPYTRALIAAVPVAGGKRVDQSVIRGETPSSADPPPGCRFHPRCPEAMPVCRQSPPGYVEQGGEHWVMCHLYG